MKKIIAITLCILFLFVLCSCDDKNNQDIPSSNMNDIENSDAVSEQSNTTNTSNTSSTSSANNTNSTNTDTKCAHLWDQWSEKTRATCQTTGTKERTCHNCSLTESVTIDKTEHKESDWIIDSVAKVGKDGLKYTKCVYCNIRINEEVIPAIAENHQHTVAEWITIKAPTCTANGTQNAVCSCGKTIDTKKTPSKGHSPIVDKAVAATCTSNGLTEGSHCSVCGTVINKQNKINKLAHTSVTDRAVPASCTSGGLTEGSHCSVCGTVLVKQTSVEKTGHTFVNGICNCGVAESLEYTLSADSNYYILSGIGTYTGTDIVIPETYNGLPVKEIAPSAFNSSSITSIRFNKNIKKVGDWAFYGCKSLTEVHIKDIGQWCSISWGSCNWNPLYYAQNLYLNDSLLTDLIIPDTVEVIESNTFPKCASIKSITLGKNTYTIDDGAFRECSSLVTFNGNDKLIEIGAYAFYRCTNLATNLVFSDSLLKINNYAFQECYKLCSIDFANSLQLIGEGAFLNCRQIKEVTIPATTQKIGKYAFKGCSSVTDVYFEKTTTWTCSHSSYPASTMGEATLSYSKNACLCLVNLYSDRLWERH